MDDDKQWTVCHFTEEETVEAVPTIWMDTEQKCCYWPPKHLKRLIKDLIKKKENPDKDWQLYPAVVLGQYGMKQIKSIVSLQSICQIQLFFL